MEDLVGNRCCWLVLPESEHEPACVEERGVGFAVAHNVSLELRSPVAGVRLRCRRVFRAAVPEAPVDEDCDAPSGEHDVGTSTSAEWSVVDPVAQPGGVEQSAHCELRRGIPPAVRHHGAPRSLARCPGHGDSVRGRTRRPTSDVCRMFAGNGNAISWGCQIGGGSGPEHSQWVRPCVGDGRI